ncbi:ATPase domain-containing protein [Hydrogenophaga pseudoflava]|uniref:ATPase domain-containing protein n=1 Tax=Hydrogenophaga pseudoflava TaxID=47421 RepID=UPI0027E47247|nr:ATPase domain-containing protein [Hydrogenophaga pseudoflava]MDQ7744416.1 ATPase domain-containing protein [Hydrogenophaga pseudoflava]
MPKAPLPSDPPHDLIQTGVPGLDDVLGGGLTKGRLYLVEGSPGTGKTTIALQYLMEGVRLGERVLYVTLSETETELQGVAASHGWDLSGIEAREMLPSVDQFLPDELNTLFHPSEVELGEASLRILADVERVDPSRVVFDSLSELRLLAGNSLRYRRQILAFKQFFSRRSCTVLLLDDMTAPERDLQVQSIAHGVLHLEHNTPAFGDSRRRLIVLKFRGKLFRGGYHDYRIARGGFLVFPRLVATEHTHVDDQEHLSSGVKDLDDLLGGGLRRGSSTLLVGAPGTGKSTVAMQFALAAADRGECAALFLFDESIATMRTRTEGMGMPLSGHMEAGRIRVCQVDPAQLSPGEFVHEIRRAVSEYQAKVLVIDSLNGYLNAMPEDRFLIVQLHELLTYLGRSGVATILIGAQHGIFGLQMDTPLDASYLADTVVLLRYFEAEGEVRQAISVMKKRGGQHERSIRSFRMTGHGIALGPPLRQFHGVLSGVPVSLGGSAPGPGNPGSS